MARMFVILYDEAAEEDLRALRTYEVRRILNERQEVIVRAIRRKGTKTTKEIL